MKYLKIDLVELRQAIRGMKKHQALYHLLREELISLGKWRNKPRGNPQKAFKMGIAKWEINQEAKNKTKI